MLSDSIVLPFNDWESTQIILEKNSRTLACVVLEPFEEGVIAARRDFMDDLRKWTEDLIIPLIFDEVKTAFRVRVGGASEFYGVTPDITCLGKIIGGGLPIGAVVGNSRIMAQLDPRHDQAKKVFHSGTFSGNPISLAAGVATVEEMKKKGRFDTIERRTAELKGMPFCRTIDTSHRSHPCGRGGNVQPVLCKSGDQEL